MAKLKNIKTLESLFLILLLSFIIFHKIFFKISGIIIHLYFNGEEKESLRLRNILKQIFYSGSLKNDLKVQKINQISTTKVVEAYLNLFHKVEESHLIPF